jgi:hypothetical protein
MKRNSQSRQSKSGAFASLAAILLCVAFASATQVFAQIRLGRPPSGRQTEGTPMLPAGSRVIQEGTLLVVVMDSELDSGSARVNDRFVARVATPVLDANGRTLLPANARIEGHVTNVKRAKWGHRAGELGLSFDHIRLGDGRTIPLRGSLAGTNKRIDEEGNLQPGSAVRRDLLITTGGAGAGVGIGAATGGGMLAGGGIGAAAGLTFALLIKGKNVKIEPGDRFNFQLAQALPPISSATRRRQPGQAQPGLSHTDPNTVRTAQGAVPIYDARAERDADGLVRVLITAQTPTNGWRIYTHHETRGDTLEVRVRGVPPASSGFRQISHPNAPTVCVHDRNGAIRRIIVQGSSGSRTLIQSPGAGSGGTIPYLPQATLSGSQPTGARPTSGPSDATLFGLPGNGTAGASSLPLMATQVANQIDVLRMNYAAAIGLWRTNGSFNSLAGRTQTANERRLLDTLTHMHSSARALSGSSISVADRQRNAQQLQADWTTAQQYWLVVRPTGIISQDLEQQWQNLQGRLRTLIDTALR